MNQAEVRVPDSSQLLLVQIRAGSYVHQQRVEKPPGWSWSCPVCSSLMINTSLAELLLRSSLGPPSVLPRFSLGPPQPFLLLACLETLCPVDSSCSVPSPPPADGWRPPTQPGVRCHSHLLSFSFVLQQSRPKFGSFPSAEGDKRVLRDAQSGPAGRTFSLVRCV